MTTNDLKQIGDLIDKKLTATEVRLKKEVLTSDKRIMVDIGSFMENTLFPMLNEKIEEKADKADIDRLERKLDRVLDKNLNHDR